MSKKILAFIAELVLIVLGVLIAMWINNWNEDRKDKQYIKQMLSSVNKELLDSTEEIVTSFPPQESFIDSLNHYLEDDEVSILEIVLKTNGINLPTIKTNSWKAISNSRMDLLDYDKVSALANIEEQKGNLSLKIDKFLDFVYANSGQTAKDKKELLKIMMLDIMGTEERLQVEIEGVTTQ